MRHSRQLFWFCIRLAILLHGLGHDVFDNQKLSPSEYFPSWPRVIFVYILFCMARVLTQPLLILMFRSIYYLSILLKLYSRMEYSLNGLHQDLISEFIVRTFHHVTCSDLYSTVFTEQSYMFQNSTGVLFTGHCRITRDGICSCVEQSGNSVVMVQSVNISKN